ncbi:hypothetical protein [Cellulomonas soli]
MLVVGVLVLVLLLAWPIGLALWANGLVQHTSALSGAPNTPGTTYLLTGSDSRADGAVGEDGTEGHVPTRSSCCTSPTTGRRRSSRCRATHSSTCRTTVRRS